MIDKMNLGFNLRSLALYIVLLLFMLIPKYCGAQTIQTITLPFVEFRNNLLEGALLSLLFFSIAGAMPLCSFFAPAVDKRSYAISLVSLCAGGFSLASTGLIATIINSPVLWEILAMITLYLLPVGICTFISKSFLKESKMFFLHYLARIYTPFALLALIATVTNLTTFAATMKLFFLLLFLTLTSLILVLQKSARAGKTNAEIIMIGVIVLLASGLIPNVNNALGTFLPLGLAPLWGLLGFVGCLIISFKKGKNQVEPASCNQNMNRSLQQDLSLAHSSDTTFNHTNSAGSPATYDLHMTKNKDGLQNIKTSLSSFTHELSTPLGTGILAATHLAKETEELHELFRDGDLRKSDLEKHLLSYKESADIIATNLQNAADIIRHYKNEITGDTPLTRQTFNIRQHIKQVLAELKPRILQAGHEIHFSCPDDVTIHSYPSMFTQIISNLIINSLTHAYQPLQKGNLSLTVSLAESILELKYSDDGNGIDQRIINKIFDPYFTTNIASGNTGLGLSIVHNLVTHHLNGHIQCYSVPGKCTTFLIRIPMERR